MTKTYLLIIVILCLISLSFSWQYHRQQLIKQLQINQFKQSIYWFDQIVDHFDFQSDKTWSQRYFVFDDYFNPEKGPIILYICGQAECRGINDQSWTAKIAEQTQGLVLSLEHRYYGKSMPFGVNSLSKEKLKYLTSEQALNDLAYFLSKMKSEQRHGIRQKSPWITIGGSYPGALAAWFRSKYPHLTVGSISSSGVILAVQNFRQFDEQIYISAIKSGNFCADAIKNVTDYVEQQVTSDAQQAFQTQFNAQKLTSREFLFYWSDAIVFQIQYGNRLNFCNSLKNKTLQQEYNIMKQIVKKVTPVDYGAYYLKNVTYAIEDGRGARSWIYQSCSEFSYFQTYSLDHPMRSKLLSLSFYQKWCEDIFGSGSWPYVDRVNIEFGGLDIMSDNLIMTNGDQDPWQWASLRKSQNPKIYSKIITCDNCAHCVDLHIPNSHDAKDLINTRDYEFSSIKKWISDYWKQNK